MIRSPLFYVGDKYKLVPQLLRFFPKNINKYIEPFYGGGSSQLQVEANSYLLNDLDENIIGIHKMLLSYTNRQEEFYATIFRYIGKYGLSCSLLCNEVPDSLKKQYPKTYFSKYNKEAYSKMKEEYNKNKSNYELLYLLLIYGFNHMVRFNSDGMFNLPVGNVDFNKNVLSAIKSYFLLQNGRKIRLSCKDYEAFLRTVDFEQNDFVYLDPPYLISMSEYNKFWNEANEIKLYSLLDELSSRGVRFGITNLIEHKGKKNEIFLRWAQKYKIEYISSNYISFNDNTIKSDSVEVYVHN